MGLKMYFSIPMLSKLERRKALLSSPPITLTPMHLKVHILKSRQDRELALPDGADGMLLVKELGLYPDTTIVMDAATNRPVPIDEPLTDGARLTVIEVVSGG